MSDLLYWLGFQIGKMFSSETEDCILLFDQMKLKPTLRNRAQSLLKNSSISNRTEYLFIRNCIVIPIFHKYIGEHVLASVYLLLDANPMILNSSPLAPLLQFIDQTHRRLIKNKNFIHQLILILDNIYRNASLSKEERMFCHLFCRKILIALRARLNLLSNTSTKKFPLRDLKLAYEMADTVQKKQTYIKLYGYYFANTTAMEQRELIQMFECYIKTGDYILEN